MLTRYLIAACAALVFFTTACNTNRQPRYDMTAPLEIKAFKRFAAHPNVDFIHVWDSKVYDKADKPIREKGLSPSQAEVLERHGQPDYIREEFKATTGETVNEWAWWDRSVVAQFVQRELVWEGTLTDMDSYRIRYGNPRRASAQQYEQGARRDIWDYQGRYLDTKGMLVTFTDEKLVSLQNY